MKKLLITYLFTVTSVFSAPPTYFNGELQTNTYIQNIKAPNYQTTPLGGIDRRLETGNLNELQNPSFEHSTVTTGWTISNATSSSSATRIEGGKSLSLALTGALSLSQSSTINASQKSGVQMVASVFVNSSDVSDLQLCSLKNGAEDKCTVTGGYVQGSGWRQLTVSFLGDSTSNGLKLKSTDTSGTVLVDQAFVGIGSPVVDFTPDMVFSAKVSSTGAVSDENTDWISGDASLSVNAYTITFKTGLFTVAPNCGATLNEDAGNFAIISAVSASSVTVKTYSDASANSTRAFVIKCQKQGPDYKTSKAYVASSSDYGWTAYTPTFTGFGTTSSNECFHKRKGSDLYLKCKFISGTTTATEARIAFPNSLITTAFGSIRYAGQLIASTSTSAPVRYVLSEQSVGYLTIGRYASADTGAFTKQLGTSFNVGELVSFEAGPIPIQGWTDPGVIVGSFQGYNETPGTSRIETFSVSFGTTNATTVCSASPCSYLDQIGNAVTSMVRNSTGNYTMNTSKTYTKLKCSPPQGKASGDLMLAVYGDGTCSNCSSLNFRTYKSSDSNVADSFGTILCQGIPQ